MTGERQGFPRGEGLGATRGGKLEGQASFTTYKATSGGKNRPAAGAFFVGQPVDPRRDEAQRPFADKPFAEFHLSSGGGKRLSIGQQ
jgi:hypothetical protein